MHELVDEKLRSPCPALTMPSRASSASNSPPDSLEPQPPSLMADRQPLRNPSAPPSTAKSPASAVRESLLVVLKNDKPDPPAQQNLQTPLHRRSRRRQRRYAVRRLDHQLAGRNESESRRRHLHPRRLPESRRRRRRRSPTPPTAPSAANADVGVLVIGEEPCAEYRGDRAQPQPRPSRHRRSSKQ